MKIILLIFSLYSFSYVEIKNKESLLTKQDGKFWCWAATYESVMKYYGYKEDQMEFIKKFYSISHVFPHMINSPELALPDTLIMEYYAKIGNEKITALVADIDDAEYYLKRNIPIIAMYSNHVSVIVGKNKNKFLIMNTDKSDKDFIWLSKDEISLMYGNEPSVFLSVFPKEDLDKIRTDLKIF